MDCSNCGHPYIHNSYIGGYDGEPGDIDESTCRKCGLTIYWSWDLDDNEDIDWPEGIFVLNVDGWGKVYAALPPGYEPPPWLICDCGFERLPDHNEDYTAVVSAECYFCGNIWKPESVQV